MARPISASIPTNTPEGKKAYMAAWWRAHPEKKKAYDKKYHAKNKAAQNARSRAYYVANKEAQRERQKQYNQANKDKLMAMWERNYRKRRAVLAGVESEPYTKAEIMAKSNNTCHICTYQIDLSLRWPNPMSFSFDHVIPLNKGGSDLIPNIEAAHLRCNLRKFTNLIGESA